MNFFKSVRSIFFLSIVLSTGSLFGMMSSRSLISAVKKGDVSAAQSALEKGANVNVKDSLSTTRKTALMIAVEKKDAQMAKLLIEKGADLNARTWLGQTPLIIAAENGLIDMARLLLDSGAILLKASDFAQPYSKGLTRRTALMHAVARNDIPMVTLLLERGADPTIIMQVQTEKALFGLEFPTMESRKDFQASLRKNIGISALSLAAAIGSEPMVKLLLGAGEFDPINISTAQTIAAKKGNFELARLLGDPSPLAADHMYIAAIEADDFDEAKRLLDEGAYVDALPYGPVKPGALLLAISKGNPKMVELLFDNSATYRPGFLFEALVRGNMSVAKVIIDRGYGSLFERSLYRIFSKISGSKKDITLLMRYAVKKARKQPITSEETAQMRAAAKRTGISVAAITALIAAIYGLKKTSEFYRSNTLHTAAHEGSVPKVRAFLLTEHVDSFDRQGLTPLMYAARQGNVQVVNLLIRHGAEVNRQNRRRMSPLMYASRNGHDQVVKLLLANGASRDMRDDAGLRAYDYAQNHPKVLNEFRASVTTSLQMGRKQAQRQMEEGGVPDSPLGALPAELIEKISRAAAENPEMSARERDVRDWQRRQGTRPMTPTAEAERDRRLRAIERQERADTVGAGAGASAVDGVMDREQRELLLKGQLERLKRIVKSVWDLRLLGEKITALKEAMDDISEQIGRAGAGVFEYPGLTVGRVQDSIENIEQQLKIKELERQISDVTGNEGPDRSRVQNLRRNLEEQKGDLNDLRRRFGIRISAGAGAGAGRIPIGGGMYELD
ncbi:ankyrin repeat domain-containing protein [Candidatus Dependentiae bacterium]